MKHSLAAEKRAADREEGTSEEADWVELVIHIRTGAAAYIGEDAARTAGGDCAGEQRAADEEEGTSEESWRCRHTRGSALASIQGTDRSTRTAGMPRAGLLEHRTQTPACGALSAAQRDGSRSRRWIRWSRN